MVYKININDVKLKIMIKDVYWWLIKVLGGVILVSFWVYIEI